MKLFGNKEEDLRFVSKNSDGSISGYGNKANIKIKLSDYDRNSTYIIIPLLGDKNNYNYDTQVAFPNI